jgi:hypothetical protein
VSVAAVPAAVSVVFLSSRAHAITVIRAIAASARTREYGVDFGMRSSGFGRLANDSTLAERFGVVRVQVQEARHQERRVLNVRVIRLEPSVLDASPARLFRARKASRILSVPPHPDVYA